MKVPISENELGIVKYVDHGYAYFVRNGTSLYERYSNGAHTMTWKEFKLTYPNYTYFGFLWRSKNKNYQL